MIYNRFGCRCTVVEQWQKSRVAVFPNVLRFEPEEQIGQVVDKTVYGRLRRYSMARGSGLSEKMCRKFIDFIGHIVWFLIQSLLMKDVNYVVNGFKVPITLSMTFIQCCLLG